MWKTDRSAIRFAWRRAIRARDESYTSNIDQRVEQRLLDRPVALSILSTGTRLYAETPWRSRFRPIASIIVECYRKNVIPLLNQMLGNLVRDFNWKFIYQLDRNWIWIKTSCVINCDNKNFPLDVHNLKYIGEISCIKVLIDKNVDYGLIVVL